MWFAEAMRAPGTWDRKVPPLPITGNTVDAYIEIMDYYVALGREIRATRADLADFVYLAGWGVDLDAFVDPPGAKPRETLGTVLERAAKAKVEIRVVLPDQPKEGQAGSLARVAKLGGGGILDPFHKLVGTHHQKFVVIRNAGGMVAFCGGCDVDNARLGRDGVPAGEAPKIDAQKSAPWHDVQVRIRGPIAADLWNSFLQRYEEVKNWYIIGMPLTQNPVTGMTVYEPYKMRQPDPSAASVQSAGLDVQVVRTYPNKGKKHVGDELILYPREPGYGFSPNGEMSIYRLLVHCAGTDATDDLSRGSVPGEHRGDGVEPRHHGVHPARDRTAFISEDDHRRRGYGDSSRRAVSGWDTTRRFHQAVGPRCRDQG